MPYFVSNIYAIVARVFLPPEPPVLWWWWGGDAGICSWVLHEEDCCQDQAQGAGKEEGHQAPKPKKPTAVAKPTKNPLDYAKMAFFWV